jgi:hypothetical protein
VTYAGSVPAAQRPLRLPSTPQVYHMALADRKGSTPREHQIARARLHWAV